jgi:hypothetical protein
MVDEREIRAGRRRSIADALKLVPTALSNCIASIGASRDLQAQGAPEAELADAVEPGPYKVVGAIKIDRALPQSSRLPH